MPQYLPAPGLGLGNPLEEGAADKAGGRWKEQGSAQAWVGQQV